MNRTATLERPAVIRSAARPGRPVPPTVPASGLRLTRRGRLVLVALVAFVVVVVALAGAASVSAVTSAPEGPATATVVVAPGQTLWEVAEEVAPDEDPRDVIAAIAELNDLPGSIVAPGQSLIVPA